jgi:hypothetical protein
MDKEDITLPKGTQFTELICFRFANYNFLYLATIAKIVKEVLPDDIKCSSDARDIILNCCIGKFKLRIGHNFF